MHFGSVRECYGFSPGFGTKPERFLERFFLHENSLFLNTKGSPCGRTGARASGEVKRRQSPAPWAGRRSINSRGAEVERSEVREWSEAQVRRLTADDRRSPAERSEGAQCRSQCGRDSEERASERFARELARAPARRKAVRRCWCRWLSGGPERALGAALASGPNGEGELATRAVGCPVRVALVKSPRLALERLQCNHSATLFARMGNGERVGGQRSGERRARRGRRRDGLNGGAGGALGGGAMRCQARRRLVAALRGGLVPILSSAALAFGARRVVVGMGRSLVAALALVGLMGKV